MTLRLDWAESTLGYEFANTELLEQALTHRSASKANNERLEYLGDSFLNYAIARRLFSLQPDASEGDLSRLRAYLVRGTTLAAIAREIDLDRQIVVGAGELRAGGASRESVLANAVEALIGAIVLDGGAQAADRCIDRLFAARLESLPSGASLKDPKTRLQEWLQARGMGLPSYTVESTVGQPHKRTFTVLCEIDQAESQCRGTGASRRKAEQDAAAAMLATLEGASGKCESG